MEKLISFINGVVGAIAVLIGVFLAIQNDNFIFCIYGVMCGSIFFGIYAIISLLIRIFDEIKPKSLEILEPNIPIHETQLKNGMKVVELKTERQMNLGEQLLNGKFKCYENGVYVGDFDTAEFIEFNKWLDQIQK